MIKKTSFLLIILPYVISSECIPSHCSSGCCATRDKCAANANDCSKSQNYSLMLGLVVSIVLFILVTSIIYVIAKKLVERGEHARNIELQNRVPAAGNFAPIVEVQTIPNCETEVEVIEEKPIQGEEINHSVFIKHIKEDRQTQERYREAIYHYYEDHGEKPKKKEEKGIKKEIKREETEEEGEYPAIVLINAV